MTLFNTRDTALEFPGSRHLADCLFVSAGMIPLMIVYFFLQKYYRRSYVELQRCDATSRSPVYAHFSESLTGVETIRAFRYQEKFAAKSDTQIDYNHRYCCK